MNTYHRTVLKPFLNLRYIYSYKVLPIGINIRIFSLCLYISYVLRIDYYVLAGFRQIRNAYILTFLYQYLFQHCFHIHISSRLPDKIYSLDSKGFYHLLIMTRHKCYPPDFVQFQYSFL